MAHTQAAIPGAYPTVLSQGPLPGRPQSAQGPLPDLSPEPPLQPMAVSGLDDDLQPQVKKLETCFEEDFDKKVEFHDIDESLEEAEKLPPLIDCDESLMLRQFPPSLGRVEEED